MYPTQISGLRCGVACVYVVCVFVCIKFVKLKRTLKHIIIFIYNDDNYLSTTLAVVVSFVATHQSTSTFGLLAPASHSSPDSILPL